MTVVIGATNNEINNAYAAGGIPPEFQSRSKNGKPREFTKNALVAFQIDQALKHRAVAPVDRRQILSSWAARAAEPDIDLLLVGSGAQDVVAVRASGGTAEGSSVASLAGARDWITLNLMQIRHRADAMLALAKSPRGDFDRMDAELDRMDAELDRMEELNRGRFGE